MNSFENYEIINGKKHKKCPENKIRNPITLRCIKNNYEFINGKKLKKCLEGKIRNPITLRCIKKKNESKSQEIINGKKYKKCPEGKIRCIKNKNKSAILHKKANIIKKNMKRWLLPFINRVTANINDRINYHNNLIKHFHLKDNKNYCIKLYKIDKNNNPVFRLGSNIILKNRIGSPSDYGIIYLSSFRNINGKLFKFAVKMFLHENKHLDKEVKITNRISNLVIDNICPHFLIIYKTLRCNNFNFYNNDYKTNSSSLNNSSLKVFKNLPDYYNYYPNLYKQNLNKDFHILICELANGDLKNFLNNQSYITNNYLMGNTLTQLFISLAFFTHYEKKIHYDTHSGNYLYHQIKKGGFYHYKIYDKNYYLENLGFLWMLWDFGRATDNYSQFIINHDFNYTLSFIRHKLNNLPVLKSILFNHLKLFENKFSFPEFKKYIIHFFNLFTELNFIFTSCPSNSFIINKKPFIIN